jgi:hypothetical protein
VARGRSSFFITILTVIITSFSSLVAAEEDKWQVEDWGEGVISVSTHGKVQHGDRIYFRLKKSNCDVLEHAFTFYTVANHKRIKLLEKELVPLDNNEMKIYGKVKLVFPFLMGHMVWISLGHYNVEDHIKLMKEIGQFNIEIIDKRNFIAEDYFDIPTNEWDLTNYESAITKGQRLCRQIPA